MQYHIVRLTPEQIRILRVMLHAIIAGRYTQVAALHATALSMKAQAPTTYDFGMKALDLAVIYRNLDFPLNLTQLSIQLQKVKPVAGTNLYNVPLRAPDFSDLQTVAAYGFSFTPEEEKMPHIAEILREQPALVDAFRTASVHQTQAVTANSTLPPGSGGKLPPLLN